VGTENFTDLKLPIQYPLVLLVQLGWGYAAYKRSRAFGLSLCLEDSVTRCKEILIVFGRLRSGEKFEVSVGGGLLGKHEVQSGIFGSNSAFAVRPRKNHGKPLIDLVSRRICWMPTDFLPAVSISPDL
jgi:hypothetical protein